MSVEKVCRNCGKKFEVPNRRHETVKFCSKDCKAAYGWETLKCSKCGKEFKRKRSDGANSVTKYCSRECYDATKLGKLRGPKGERHYKKCLTCGKEFRITKTRLETAMFCSMKCKLSNVNWRDGFVKKMPRAEDHWRWMGGKYDSGRIYKRNSRDVGVHREIMTKLLYEKDPDHPFLDLSSGEPRLFRHIHVHHIDRNPANNSPDNLLALTMAAHARLHHTREKPHPWECWPSNPDKW